MRKTIVSIFLLLLLSGCSSKESTDVPKQIEDLDNLTVYPGDMEPEFKINLEPVASFEDTKKLSSGRFLRV